MARFLLFSLAMVGLVQCRAAPSEPANLILISIDCLNQRQFAEATRSGVAPEMARLAGQSVVFSRAYAHAPWTTPSHMSMLTGLPPRQHGREVPWGLMIATNPYSDRVPAHPSVPTALAEAGYETAAFVGKGSISAQYGLGRGFALYHETPRPEAAPDLPPTLTAFRQWLGSRQPKPFFLFVHTYDMHDPRPPEMEEDARVIAHVDRQIGALLDELRRAGLFESSLIFLTGDHGSKMVQVEGRCCVHGGGHYEENIRVPLVMKLPDQTQARASSALARHVDLLPTAAQVLDFDTEGYDGRGVSLLDVLEGSVETAFSFSEADARCAKRYGVVTERFKYIHTPRSAEQMLLRASPLFLDNCAGDCEQLPQLEELYDLEADPEERHNLLLAPLEAEAAAALDRLRSFVDRSLDLPPRYSHRVLAGAQPQPLDPELKRSLEALGYLE